MKNILAGFVLSLALVPLALVTSGQAAESKVAAAAIDGFIIPGYERVIQEAELQSASLDNLCTTPSAENLSAARDQFAALVQAWSRIEIIRFGPVLTDNRADRVLFWPDRSGIALRQVQRLLLEKPENALDVETLQIKSVALQGLGALEFSLFGTGSDALETDAPYRCTYAGTIADAIAATTEKVLNDWLEPDGIASWLRNPLPENPNYRTNSEIMSEMLGIWAHTAELLRDTRIRPFLGASPDKTKPKAALLWRSGQTIAALRANIEGMRDLMIISGIDQELPDTERWAAGSLIFELDNFSRTANQIDRPIADVLGDATSWGKANYLRILTGSIQKLTAEQLAPALGAGFGFSALDGD